MHDVEAFAEAMADRASELDSSAGIPSEKQVERPRRLALAKAKLATVGVPQAAAKPLARAFPRGAAARPANRGKPPLLRLAGASLDGEQRCGEQELLWPTRHPRR